MVAWASVPYVCDRWALHRMYLKGAFRGVAGLKTDSNQYYCLYDSNTYVYILEHRIHMAQKELQNHLRWIRQQISLPRWWLGS